MKKKRINPDKAAYVIYADWMEVLLEYPDELILEISKSIYRYCLYKEEPKDSTIKYSIFSLIKKRLDEDESKYEDKVKKTKEARSEAGKKGMQKRYSKTNKSNNCLTNNNKTNTDNDNDNDTQNLNSLNLCVDKGSNTHTEFEKFKDLSDYSKSENDLYKQFINWIPYNAPNLLCLAPPTEIQFNELLNLYDAKFIGDVCLSLNNQPIKVKSYGNLYQTLKVWCDTEKRYREKSRQQEDRFSRRRGTETTATSASDYSTTFDSGTQVDKWERRRGTNASDWQPKDFTETL